LGKAGGNNLVQDRLREGGVGGIGVDLQAKDADEVGPRGLVQPVDLL